MFVAFFCSYGVGESALPRKTLKRHEGMQITLEPSHGFETWLPFNDERMNNSPTRSSFMLGPDSIVSISHIKLKFLGKDRFDIFIEPLYVKSGLIDYHLQFRAVKEPTNHI